MGFAVNAEERRSYHTKIFEETAANEKQHTKDHLRMLKDIGDTLANLKTTIGGKNYETMEMCSTFGQNAYEIHVLHGFERR